ncbi:ribosome-inactivating family protein [Micromonospora sp. NPDC018662]|uniref:ribosome-inactivating family protein n=1 Tax=Micromonospora sp. NPDC018662 TaxID=3364238 RepID=UPI00378ACD97
MTATRETPTIRSTVPGTRSAVARRLGAVLTALAVLLGLAAAVPPRAAQADPSTTLSIIDWNVSDITAGGNVHHQRYWNMIDGIHQFSGHQTGVTSVMETTNQRNRIIQIRVLDTDNVHLVSLYLWADDLYLAGWYSPLHNRHVLFNDRDEQFRSLLGLNPANVTVLAQTGSYPGLDGGTPNQRAEMQITPSNIYNNLRLLGRSNAYNVNVGHALVQAIVMISEAARFGTVFDTIRDNIRNYRSTPINHVNNDGVFENNAGLMNQWEDISRFVVRHAADHTNNEGIWLWGKVVTTIAGLLYYVKFVEIKYNRP